MSLTRIVREEKEEPNDYFIEFPEEAFRGADLVHGFRYKCKNGAEAIFLQEAIEAYVQWRLIKILDQLSGEGEMWDPKNWENLNLTEEAKARLEKAWEKKNA